MIRGSKFTVQVQNVSGSTLLRQERHATDMSVASETARRAGRARLARRARRAPNTIGQSGLSGSCGLFGWTDRESSGNHAESARERYKAYPAFEAP